ncbi:MAG: beta strand repeat-containing protein, partial [Verrucomicrobiota bacterium]
AIGDGTGAAITINSTGTTEFVSTVNTASGIIQSAAAGTVTFRDNVTIAGTGDTDSNFSNSVVLDGLTFTSGDGVVFGSSVADVVTLSGGPVTLAMTGTTTVNAIVNGNQDLVINSTGATTFNAAVGGTVPATEIGDGTGASITFGAGAGAVTFESTVRTKSGITQNGTAGLVTFRGDVTVAAGDTASTFNGNVTLDGLTFTTAKAVTFGDATTDTLTLSTAGVTITATSTGADGAVTFNSAVNGPVALTVNTAGATTFNGVVGPNITTLTTDAAGTTTINTATIGGGVLDFNDAIILETSTTLTGTTSVDFASTVNSATGEANSLTINSPVTGFHGVVGGTVGGALGTLTTDAAGTTTLDTTAITAAVVDFNDAILLTADVIVTGTTSVDFASTVNSSGAARDLTVNSPVTGFNGIVGGTLALDVLTTDAAGTTTIDTSAINAAVVDLNDAVVVNQALTITGTTSIDFASTVNSQLAEANNLTLNSPVTGFHGIVGALVPLGTLSTDAAGITTIDTTAMTAAVLDFNDAVVVDTSSTLTGTTSVDFASTLNSAENENNNLTINSPTTGFHGIVGAAAPLGTLSTDAAGTTTIDTTAVTANVVDFNDAVVVDQDLLLTGLTSVDFALTVNSATGEANDLTVNSPVTAFHGIVGGAGGGALGTLTTDAAGVTTIDTTAITGATLDFNDQVTLSQNVVLNGTTTVDFAQTVDSDAIGTPRSLLVNSPLTVFGGAVGGSLPLASLTTDVSGGANLTRINGGSVTTTGDQLYNDTVRLGANTILTGNDITFMNLLDSSEGALRTLLVNSTGGGITTFNGAIGTLDRLARLETNLDGRTDINAVTINLNGASALFNDPVLLLANLTINEAGIGSITFNNTLNGAFALVVNSDGGGLTIFNGIVGGGAALVSITTDADGATQINGGTVTTTGFQLYNDPVTIGANTVLNSTALGNITFVTTLDGPFTLLVNTAGTTTFGGPVGSITPLNSVTTDAPGFTAINGGSVLTFGTQTYNDPVTLGANTVITSTGAAALGNVTFNSTLDSAVGPFSLIVNTAGNTDFNGAVGGIGALLSLTTDAPGTVSIDGGAVTTTTFQLYNDPATIGANTVLTSTGAGNITFMQTLDGAFTLNVNTAGISIFNGVVGGITPLVSLVTDGPGSTQVNGTAVNTTGIQTYGDPTTVGANTTFTSTGVGAAGNITFVTTLDDDAVAGAANVIVNTAGATTFGGAVGGITPLTSLTTDAPGNVRINGGLVTTVNNQTYNDVATLGADTVLNSLLAGNITFAQTLDDDLTIPANTSNLIVNTSGVTTFGGVVGGISPLTSITTDPAVGPVIAGDITAINGGLVITTGFQTYNDNVTVNQDTVLTSLVAGNITIGQPNPPVPWGLTTLMGTVPGVDMIINALGGNVQINAAVSGVDTLNGFATGTYIAANPGNTGINLHLSLPNSPFVFIYTSPMTAFNLNNSVYSMEEIFGRDVPNLFKYPGDAKDVTSDISVLLTTNQVEKLIGAMPTDKIFTSYDLAALEEARKNR